ncbi:UDP-N-acetylmuramate--L-alanine ligase [bacterium]|nr:UDP-N-acetylmuramate--L-alanine ligase [bacterium]
MTIPETLDALSKDFPIHFIGIGGCGMSGIALSLRGMGYAITGSDMAESEALGRLREAGIDVAIGHNGGNIPAETQLVVATAAVKPGNPEYMAAEVRGIPIVKYARMLGILMRSKCGIAIAGTHGKTTTTAMVTFALKALGSDPSFVIGGDVPQLGGGSGVGESDFLVVEACEYDRSFLSLFPRFALINNIEEDHLDYYKDLDEIVGAFRDFTMRLPADGLLVYSASSPNIARFIKEAPCRAVSCALEREADYQAHDIRLENGRSLYQLVAKAGILPGRAEAETCEVVLHTFGRHNVINSLGAIALLHQLGFGLKESAEAVGGFSGVRRRFDIIYDQRNVCVVDDYAHHPTEVQTVLKSSKAFFDGRRVIAVFQPHQHSRTRFLMRDFAQSFRFADLVVVPDIYFVRDSEQEKEMVHARDLVRAIIANGGNAVYIPSFTDIEKFLLCNLNEGDVLLTMGAGNVWQIGRHVAEELARRQPAGMKQSPFC